MIPVRALETVIKELRPELVDDYLRFFDEVYTEDPWLNTQNNPWWGICYCGFYDDPRTEQERNTAPDAANKNRDRRAETTRSGKAHGLLAYVDGKIVGWCNAGPRTSYRNLHNLVPAGESPGEVGSILCFVVAAPFRGKGVCTSLLHAACDKLRDDGLEVAEGYPSTLPPDVNNPYNTPAENQNYRGPLRMFLKSGFAVHQQLERHAIVRKPLGPRRPGESGLVYVAFLPRQLRVLVSKVRALHSHRFQIR